MTSFGIDTGTPNLNILLLFRRRQTQLLLFDPSSRGNQERIHLNMEF